MLSLSKDGVPMGEFTTYDDFYHYLQDWGNRERVERHPPSAYGFLSPIAIEGIINAIGIDYGSPTYHAIRRWEVPPADQPASQPEGGSAQLTPAPLTEGAPKGRGYRKQWCLAYCSVYGLDLKETGSQGGQDADIA